MQTVNTTNQTPTFAKFIKALKSHLAKKAAGQRTTYPYAADHRAFVERLNGAATDADMASWKAAKEEALNA